MKTKNRQIECKSTQLIAILSENFAGEMNLARMWSIYWNGLTLAGD
jgi:hypothetical protein